VLIYLAVIIYVARTSIKDAFMSADSMTAQLLKVFVNGMQFNMLAAVGALHVAHFQPLCSRLRNI
jgi:hypothetical protein